MKKRLFKDIETLIIVGIGIVAGLFSALIHDNLLLATTILSAFSLPCLCIHFVLLFKRLRIDILCIISEYISSINGFISLNIATYMLVISIQAKNPCFVLAAMVFIVFSIMMISFRDIFSNKVYIRVPIELKERVEKISNAEQVKVKDIYIYAIEFYLSSKEEHNEKQN